MILNKDGFENLLGAYYDKMNKENLEFLKSFSFLKDINNSKLLTIILGLIKIEAP